MGNDTGNKCPHPGWPAVTPRKGRDLIREFIETRANGTLRAVVYAGIDPLAEKPRYLNDPDQAETVLTRLLACRTPCVGRKTGHQCDPLAANTIRKIHFAFQGAMKRAVKWKYVATNEAELAEPPAFEQSEPDPPPGQEAAAIRSGGPSRGPRW